VSINEYWLANSLNYGKLQEGPFLGSSSAAVLKGLANGNFRFPAPQLLELSDQGPDPHTPLKPVVEGTISDFLSTSRGQDRVMLLFFGQACEIGDEAYLVPLLGNLKEAKTLIPLSWVYDQLKSCKARQKVLVLDVCRFDPARGNVRPGSDPMGKVLDARLKAPPAGVLVWSSCIGGQNSVEFESGSVFQQALCVALQEPLPEPPDHGDALPMKLLNERVTKFLAKALAPAKLEQTPRLSGKEMEGGAAFNPDEPPPMSVTVRPPPVPGGNVAGNILVQKILDETGALPPTRAGRPGVKENYQVTSLPPFGAKDLEAFEPDSRLFLEYEKQSEKFPLRSAVARATRAMQENAAKFNLREFFGGATNAQVKKQIQQEQSAPGKAILNLEDALEELQKAGEERKAEKSKRWQAHYDLVLNRLKSRLIYLYEYDYALAQIRADALPPVEAGYAGYRLGSLPKVTIPEGKVKTWVKEVGKGWQRIIDSYPETPWSMIASREQVTALGLQWRPARK
jgi:hypothetical protein